MPKQNLYFVALLPHLRLREEIKGLKAEIQAHFGARHALKSPAHVTLQIPFKRPPQAEPEIAAALKNFAARQKPFEVRLSGFGCFSPRVVFVKIQNPKPLIQLQASLMPALAQAGLSETERRSRFHPHITLATRDVTPEIFHQIWADFQHRSFNDSFRAQSIGLLKHNGKFWEIYQEFEFEK